MNKKVSGAAIGLLLCGAGCTQNHFLVVEAHSGRRSGPVTSKQRAKDNKCHTLDMAGFAALNADQPELAEGYARQVLGLTNGYDILAPELLASALDAQGKTQEALQAYKLLAERGGDFPRIMLPYARLLLKTGQWTQAVDAYNKQLPNLDAGNMVRANSHFLSNAPRPKELAMAIHIALGLTQISSAGWGGYTREDQAMREFQQAAAMEPKSALANYYVGYGLKRLGRRAEAQAAFQKAAALDNGDIKAAALKELPVVMQPR